MEITVTTLPKSEVKLTIAVPEARASKYLQQAVEELSRHVKVPGFRPGHVPAETLKQHLKEGVIESRTLEIALQETYSEAVLKEKLNVVSRPKINILKDSPLVYEATVAVYPQVSVSGYEKVKIQKNEPVVTEKDLEDALEAIQRKHAKYQEVDRAAAMGDRVEVDFDGYDEGGAFLEKTKSRNHPLILGSQSLVKGFEEELVGLKKDEKKNFKIKFPRDYFHKPFQGKTVEFRVDVKKVEEVILPSWTPESIEQITGEKHSLDEIKTMLRTNLMREKEYEEKMRRENEFLELILKKTSVDLPETLIEEEIDSLLEEFKGELEQKGVSLEAFLEANKKELKDLREPRRKEAEKRLNLRFGLTKVFEQEQIHIVPAEVQAEIERNIRLYPENEQPKIRKEYEQNSYLKHRIENKLKMDRLFQKYLSE